MLDRSVYIKEQKDPICLRQINQFHNTKRSMGPFFQITKWCDCVNGSRHRDRVCLAWLSYLDLVSTQLKYSLSLSFETAVRHTKSAQFISILWLQITATPFLKCGQKRLCIQLKVNNSAELVESVVDDEPRGLKLESESP